MRISSPPVLVFGSERDLHAVALDFNEGLEDRSDEDLQRLLDDGRGGTLTKHR